MTFHVARAPLVLTAGAGEKKQQRVTLHCGMNVRAKSAKNNAAFRLEDGTLSCAGKPRLSLSPTGANGFEAGCAAVACRR
jgi:hypothetical protein